MWTSIALVMASYLFGSVPQNRIIARIKGVDVSQERDLHIALWRKVGRLEGAVATIIDMAKGPVPVLIGYAWGFSLYAVCLAGLAVVAGQMWPVFSRFDGEKGNTTGLAMAAALSPVAVLPALVPMAVGFFVRTVPRLADRSQTLHQRLKFGGPPSNSLPLGMIIGFAVMPLSAWLMAQPAEVVLTLLVLFVLIMVRRLTAGLAGDLRQMKDGKKRLLLNRALYDRSRF